jgi:ABC-2 type transport system ATP-binding protein
MSAIEVHDLVVRYGTFQAVSNISFDVDLGEIVTLLGPNGAGKTSTIESIEGLRKPSGGTVRVLGLDPVVDHAKLVGDLGVMLQGLGTYPQLPPLRALHLFASYYEHPREPQELLELVGLDHVARTPAKRLSGGERQRLALALALVGRPKVTFLDEPTSGIDPAGRLVVRSIISTLRREGVAVVLTTHELEEAERLADRVIIIDEGKIAASGTLSELTRVSDSIRFSTSRPVDIDELSKILNEAVSAEGTNDYRIKTSDASSVVAKLTAWLSENHYEILSLHSGRSSLEEIFLATTAHEHAQDGSTISRAGRSRDARRRSNR